MGFKRLNGQMNKIHWGLVIGMYLNGKIKYFSSTVLNSGAATFQVAPANTL